MVWADREFQVSRNAEDIAGDALKNPASIHGNELSYCVGRQTVQVDLWSITTRRVLSEHMK